jgi:hypothetical protein
VGVKRYIALVPVETKDEHDEDEDRPEQFSSYALIWHEDVEKASNGRIFRILLKMSDHVDHS